MVEYRSQLYRKGRFQKVMNYVGRHPEQRFKNRRTDPSTSKHRSPDPGEPSARRTTWTFGLNQYGGGVEIEPVSRKWFAVVSPGWRWLWRLRAARTSAPNEATIKELALLSKAGNEEAAKELSKVEAKL